MSARFLSFIYSRIGPRADLLQSAEDRKELVEHPAEDEAHPVDGAVGAASHPVVVPVVDSGVIAEDVVDQEEDSLAGAHREEELPVEDSPREVGEAIDFAVLLWDVCVLSSSIVRGRVAKLWNDSISSRGSRP